MPNPTDANLDSLKEAFRVIAFRSSRLGDWIDLEPYLRNLDASFAEFRQEVKVAVGPPPKITASRMKRLQQLWDDCKSTDFLDLRSFAEGATYLNQALPNGAGVNPENTIIGWLNGLVELVGQIETALANSDMAQLAQHCQAFQNKLSGQIADRRNAVRREVRDLCDLTILLRNQLGT